MLAKAKNDHDNIITTF